MSIFTKSKNSFEGQYPEETTILVTRKHWIILITPFIILIPLMGLPLIIRLFIKNLVWYPVFSSLYNFLVAAYFLALWYLLFYNLMMYLSNTVVLTNKRVIENQQIGFFKHLVNELERTKIQDISVKISGPIASFLDYGNIEIQTAGTISKFDFRYLPNPQRIKETITHQN